MSGCCGCLFSFVGVANIVGLLCTAKDSLGREVRVQNDSKCKQITRLVANLLALVGIFALAWASFSIGATLITAGAGLGFLGALQQGLLLALPKLIIAAGSIFGGFVMNRLGGGPVHEPCNLATKIQECKERYEKHRQEIRSTLS